MSPVLLIFLSLICVTSQTAHILDDIDICKIKIKKMAYYVPLLITAEDSNIQLIFSLCGNIPDVFPNNGSCSKTCIYNKKSNYLVTGKRSIKTLFEVEEARPTKIILILKDELKCEDEKNYEITVEMIESYSLFKKPRLTVTDCSILVEMMKPNYEQPCTKMVSSKDVIDLTPLKREKIAIPWGDEVFHISVCGTNKNCGTGIAGCLKGSKSIIKLGETTLQKVKFDKEKDELKVVSSSKDDKQKMVMEIILKCNWAVETYSHAKFINQSSQGRRYKFEMYSSYGCVKMAPNCLIEDENNGLVYDLRGLTEEAGTKVMLTSTKIMLINICGDLKGINKNKTNNCETQHSQICEIDKNTYTNKGSIPTFEITSQHSVKIFLRNGQTCDENSLYSTEIDIICSFTDKGPIVMKNENCSTKILWETTKGCPKFQSEADGCAIKTHLGVIDISNLYGDNDRNHSFSDKDTFMFNICGKLHSNCSSESDVSACYVSNGTEYIIGWNNPKFSYTNGRLQLKYFGVKCKKGSRSSLTMNFYCSHKTVPKKTSLNKRDSCTFEADIYSSSACINSDSEDCIYKNNDVKYDLTPLIAKETNYQVQDKNDSNSAYFLNICQSLINENGLIPGNSMIHLLDKSKPHIWDKYVSLGQTARPVLTNDGKLVIKSILGRMCRPGRDYNSLIHFECTSNINEEPKLLEKNDCSFKFLWRTKYACPIEDRGSCLLHGNIVVPKDDVTFEIQGNMYKFSLCADVYEVCKYKFCKKYHLTRNPLLKNNKVYVEVKLENHPPCSKDSLTVNLSLQCGRSQTNGEISNFTISQDFCRVDLLMKSFINCRNGSNFVTQEVDRISIRTDANSTSLTNISIIENGKVEKINQKTEIVIVEGDKKPKQMLNVSKLDSEENKEDGVSAIISERRIAEPIDGSHYQKCNIVKIRTKTFNLKNMELFNVTRQNTYIINFNGTSSSCGGRICRNSIAVLPFIGSCPEVFSTESHVMLDFTVEGECIINDNLTKSVKTADLKIGINLECSESPKMTVSIERNCLIGFVYYSPQICDFIESGSSLYILFSVGVIFVFIAFILGFFFYRKHRAACSYSNITERSYLNHSKLL